MSALQRSDVKVDAVFVTTLKHPWSSANPDGTRTSDWHNFVVLCVVERVEPHMAWWRCIKVLDETGRPPFPHAIRCEAGAMEGGFSLKHMGGRSEPIRLPRRADLIDAPTLILKARQFAAEKADTEARNKALLKELRKGKRRAKPKALRA